MRAAFRRRGAIVLLPALLMLGAGPTALAAPARPRTEPARDVTVTYQAHQGKNLVLQQSWWLVRRKLQRINLATSPAYIVEDGIAHTATVVDTKAHTAMHYQTHPNTALQEAGFTRLGTETIAGHTCTDWRVTPKNADQGPPQTMCYTKDGVLLHTIRTGQNVLIATAVKYGPVSASEFAIPKGYTRLDNK